MTIFKLLKQMWDFARVNKKFWMLPMVIILIIFGALLVFAETSVFAPLIYTIF